MHERVDHRSLHTGALDIVSVKPVETLRLFIVAQGVLPRSGGQRRQAPRSMGERKALEVPAALSQQVHGLCQLPRGAGIGSVELLHAPLQSPDERGRSAVGLGCEQPQEILPGVNGSRIYFVVAYGHLGSTHFSAYSWKGSIVIPSACVGD